jgi:hypothetical protein
LAIGTTSPTYRLEVYGTSSSDGISTNVGLNFQQVTSPTTGTTSLVASAGNIDAGQHFYLVTFTTALGETNAYLVGGPSGSVTTDASHGQVTVTIPTSSDPRVTGRKIYRTKAVDGSSYWQDYLLTTINDNTTTTYTDNTADAGLSGTAGMSFNRVNTTNNFITLNGANVVKIDSNLASFGTCAGQSLTTGGYDAFFGSSAGVNTTTGYKNSFFGWGSGYYNTSGYSNSGFGMNAMANNTSGNGNTAVGREALNYNRTGNNNTAVGLYASWGSSGNSNSYNSSLGSYALYGVTTGNYNTVMGYQSGYSVTTGSKNTFLGTNAASTTSTGSNNIAIGYNITFASTTGSNQLNIGNLIFGTGVNGEGTNLSTGNVGIGTSSPWAKLTLQGMYGSTTALFDIASTTSSGGATSSLFTVLANGNVGVGIVNPSQMLDVYGTSATAFIHGVGTVGLALTSTSNSARNLIFVNDGNNMYLKNSSDTGGQFNIRGSTNNDVAQFSFGAPSGTFMLTSAGNIGIGTTTPGSLLTIASSTATGTSSLFSIATSSPIMTVLANGNVGIGTSSPQFAFALNTGQLSVPSGSYGVGTTSPSITFNASPNTGLYLSSVGNMGFVSSGYERFTLYGAMFQGNATGAGALRGASASASGPALTFTNVTNTGFYNPTAQDIGISNNGVETVRITTSGLFGIGTTSPSATLSIQGTSSAPTTALLNIASSSGTSFLSVLANGNVGIGSTSPAYTLGVTGTFGVSGQATLATASTTGLTTADLFATNLNLTGAFSTTGSSIPLNP